MKISNFTYGFTLIELLVVIGLLSIVTTSFIVLINPLEQMARGNDTATQSDARQLIDAVNRFYANNGYYPWQKDAGDINNLQLNPVEVGESWVCSGCTSPNSVLSILSSIEGGQEISPSFVNKVSSSNYNKLYIYNGSNYSNNPNKSTYICFKPRSKLFLEKAKTKWGDNCGNVDSYSDIGAGQNMPYQWMSNGSPVITICDAINNLFATCLP